MQRGLEAWRGALEGPRHEKYAAYAASMEARIGAFIEARFLNPVRGAARGPLAGLPFAVKDNIAVKGMSFSCGSKLLHGLKAPYDATCVERLYAAGASCVGKTNLDEFGMGSSCENSGIQETKNPYDPARVPGGSSGGSAAAVAAGLCAFALGTDTGGSVRQPANFCGVYGLKPTYGAVSRFGLAAYASSLDVPGFLSRSLDTLEAAFHATRGPDRADQSSSEAPADAYAPRERPRRIVALKGVEGLDPAVAASLAAAREALESQGVAVDEVELPTLDYVVASYYTIATAEASSNLARYTGVNYGNRAMEAENPEEMLRLTRTKGFGDEVKLRILLGTYVLRSGFQDRYYHKAQAIRAAIRAELDSAMRGAEAMLMPVFPTLAFPKGDSGMDAFQQKVADKFTCTANLAGLPALALPTGLSGGLPTGVQLMGGAYGEAALFSLARLLEPCFPPPSPPGLEEGFLS
jgi:aspartyl-tRNA(Asn)/glutamyl-tRNA(Gln) amidotransferase subunit A